MRSLAVLLLLSSVAHADPTLAERVASVLGVKRLGKELTTANVIDRLKPIATVAPEKEDEQGWAFSGTASDVAWVSATFYQDHVKKGKYNFQFLLIGLKGDGDLDALEAAVRTGLQKKLGKGRKYDKTQWVWRLGDRELFLSNGPIGNPMRADRGEEKVVHLELSFVNDD
jgi:hypothetical protein